MTYRIQLSKKAKKDFLSLDTNIKKQITRKFRFYIASNQPLKYAKKLQDFKQGTYRFRIGEYRALFDVDSKGKITILVILRIKHRKDAYV